MRKSALLNALFAVGVLSGCNSPLNNTFAPENERSPKKEQSAPNLISANTRLFSLSSHFGVCVKNGNISRATIRSGQPSQHYPTIAEVISDGVNLAINIGSFDLGPEASLKELIKESSSLRRIQIATINDDNFLVVSNLGAEENIIVSIDYDEKDALALEAAIRLAKKIIVCHVSET